jgi:hypothetical protein
MTAKKKAKKKAKKRIRFHPDMARQQEIIDKEIENKKDKEKKGEEQ